MNNIADKLCHPVATTQHLFEEVDLPEGFRWSAIRLWAAKNALTLIFLSAFFAVTWTIQIILAVVK